jgi:hypothetical protein
MAYWKTTADMGLTPEQINAKCEELWQKEKLRSNRNCGDCGAKVGEAHLDYCDVPHCEACGVQKLQCECGDKESCVWDGFWPGIKECYQQKLIIFDSGRNEWCFDLNTYYRNNMK